MNVRAGDLAFIVAPFEVSGRGLVVTVDRLAEPGHYVLAKNGSASRSPEGFGPAWVCSSHDERFPLVVNDVALRPIRDPGDDAVDEILRPLPQEVAA